MTGIIAGEYALMTTPGFFWRDYELCRFYTVFNLDMDDRAGLKRVDTTRELVIGHTPFIIVYHIQDDTVRIPRILPG